MLFLSASVCGQSIQITDASASAVEGGINVNVQTISFNGADYLSHDYSIVGATINLSVCYSFNMTLPVLTFNHDFFIPVNDAGNYTVNLTVYNSASAEVCDYHSVGGSATLTVLSTTEFSEHSFAFYPNPTENSIHFDNRVDRVSIVEMTGKLVLQTNDVTWVDTDALQNGIYVVRIESDNKSIIQKLIKR